MSTRTKAKAQSETPAYDKRLDKVKLNPQRARGLRDVVQTHLYWREGQLRVLRDAHAKVREFFWQVWPEIVEEALATTSVAPNALRHVPPRELLDHIPPAWLLADSQFTLSANLDGGRSVNVTVYFDKPLLLPHSFQYRALWIDPKHGPALAKLRDEQQAAFNTAGALVDKIDAIIKSSRTIGSIFTAYPELLPLFPSDVLQSYADKVDVPSAGALLPVSRAEVQSLIAAAL